MKRNRMWLWLIFTFVGLSAASAKEGPVYLTLSLAELTQSALTHSSQLQASQLTSESAKSEALSAGNAEFPRLGLNGNYFYQTYVPAFSILPNSPQVAFGEVNNWSAWATLNWNLWDFRSQHDMANSANEASESQEQLYEATVRQVTLAVRMAYFQVKANAEQVRLLGDSLKIAQLQYADISRQAKFGTASRMDRLSSHQEVLNYQRQFRQAQANLAQSLRDLYALVGVEEPSDFTLPLDKHMEGALPDTIVPPSVWLALDTTEDSLQMLKKDEVVPPDDNVPQLKTYAYMADSSRFAANSIHSELLPKITLSAQAGYENPDGPILQTVQQNIISVSASMPLFDWGQIVNDADSKKKQAEVYEKNWSQAKTNLWRDWNKAKDELSSLKYQKKLNDTAVTETAQLAKLTYKSYKAGTVRYLEVQTANLQALDAKIQSVSNDVQILMQLSVLSSLSGKE
ncbi:MAG TPA: TolC family protein [bacterium]|jgi:outer membrane protein TolC|nr:TolC family protein [bacterium]